MSVLSLESQTTQECSLVSQRTQVNSWPFDLRISRDSLLVCLFICFEEKAHLENPRECLF